jgi:hypothetical protein
VDDCGERDFEFGRDGDERVNATYDRKATIARNEVDMTTKDVFQAALKLPKKSRVKLAERLLESLNTNEAIDAAIEEAEKNWQAYKRGEIGGRPVEEVFPNLRKRKTK